jgi:hypothetical protein
VHIRDKIQEYVTDAVLFVMFSENVVESSSQIKSFLVVTDQTGLVL